MRKKVRTQPEIKISAEQKHTEHTPHHRPFVLGKGADFPVVWQNAMQVN